MADEPENLVLAQLREIRSKLDKLDEHDKRFDRLDKQGEEMRQYMSYALGVGAMHDIKLREVDARRTSGRSATGASTRRWRSWSGA